MLFKVRYFYDNAIMSNLLALPMRIIFLENGNYRGRKIDYSKTKIA